VRSRVLIRIAVCATAIAAVALAVTSASGASSSAGSKSVAAAAAANAAKQPKQVEVYATYYGWYDNTPPGCATAYSGCARGTGTYAHPITFASDKTEFPVGTILYYPSIEKYVRMGDDCQECDEDWSGKGPDGGPRLHHLDIWIGGKGGNEFDVINCEDGLTQGMPNGAPLLTPFIENPPANMPVSTEPLFNTNTNHCFGGATTATTYGRYKNAKSGKCLTDRSATSGTPATLAACKTGAAEKLAFDGAFFVHGQLCLQTMSGKPGSAIDFVTCNGNDRQQWEINPNGTIAWIQYARCIADVSGKIELSSCSSTASDRWKITSEAAP
jgi:Ricin-type beta-trefoil lectin domain